MNPLIAVKCRWRPLPLAGTSIAAGLFYPSMVAGAALGRILGQLLQMAFTNKVVDPGTYAFIGACEHALIALHCPVCTDCNGCPGCTDCTALH